MIICVDFDGTCVTHDFPRIGKDIGAQPVLKELIAAGHELILFTMRSDKADIHSSVGIEAKGYLSEAVGWFEKNGIPLYGINTNPDQNSWTDSPKALCNLYIDDTALGCPLIYDESISYRPFVDWSGVRTLLVEEGFLV